MKTRHANPSLKKSIAILVPCYNEEKSIAKVIKAFNQALPEATIYVFDNNSTDATARIAKTSGALVFSENRQGKGNVVRTMFRQIKADCYLLVDGDDTYSARDAKKMCQPILDDEADLVIGDRLSSSYFTENKRLFHNTGNRTVGFLINKIFKSHINDVMTGYRAMSYDLVKSFSILSKGFEIETEMAIFAIDKNFRITEIPISYKDRAPDNPSKLNTYKDGARVLKTITILFKEYRPSFFFNIVSLFLYLIAIILGAPIVSEYFQTGLVPRLPTLIVSGFLVIISILLNITGIILQVIVKKNRQIYELYLNLINIIKS